MTTYKFLFDMERCIYCRGCETACKQQNNVEAGVRWRRVVEIESGTYPNVTKKFVSLACMHCTNPPCMMACPVKAIYQRDDGIVLYDRSKCIGCGYCGWACPFGAPQYSQTGEFKGLMEKCTFCADRIDKGLKPACVQTCMTSALLAGTGLEISTVKREREATKLTASEILVSP
jgi:DMSO reductase iron-sulfur subunit